MKPRGYLASFVILAAVAGPPFGILWTLVFTLMMGLAWHQAPLMALGSGVGFGVLFGFAMAFFLKAATLEVDFDDRKRFLSSLDAACEEIGYHPGTRTKRSLTYTPSMRAGLLAGRISVELDEDLATIVGPAMYVKKLKRHFKRRRKNRANRDD